MYKLRIETTLGRVDGVEKTTETKTIIRKSNNASIPFDPANTDYQAYLAWLAEGNTPEAAE
jgi:hypothetical protein